MTDHNPRDSREGRSAEGGARNEGPERREGQSAKGGVRKSDYDYEHEHEHEGDTRTELGRRGKWGGVIWLALWLLAAGVLMAAIRPASPSHQIGGIQALTRGVLAGRDTLTHDYPAAWWGWSQIRTTGKLPLWNPSWFCGEPFIASQTFMPFYPPSWLGLVLPFPLAFNIQYPLHLILAAAIMAWACRRRGLGWLAAGLAGLAWGFGGHLATLAGPGHIQKLQALAWLPMVAVGAWHLGRGQSRKGLLPLTIGLAMQITAGHLQIVYLTLLVAAGEGLAAVVASSTLAERGKPSYLPLDFRAGAAGAALLLAIGLSAVFWVPTAEFARMSNRQGALNWDDATRGSLPPEEALEFILPRLRGDSLAHGRGEQFDGPFRPAYIGRYGQSATSGSERVVSDYAGAGVLVFALFALMAGRKRRRRAAGAYCALAALFLTLSLGRYVPWLYRPALTLIPGLSHFRSPSTMMAVFAYGLTMAAALGVEGFFHPEAAAAPHERKRSLRRRGLVLLLLAGATFILATLAEAKMLQIGGVVPKPANMPELKALGLLFFHAAAVSHFGKGLFGILLCAGTWSLLQAVSASPAFRRAAGWALLGGLVLTWGVDLLTNDGPFWTAEDVRPYQNFLTDHWALPYWNKTDPPVRYLELGHELSNRALTLSDYATGRQIGSASGYHPVGFRKYFEMQEKLGFLSPNFLRLFAINYLIYPSASADQRPAGYLRFDQNEDQSLLRNPDIQYVRPVQHLETVKNWEALLERLAKPGFNAYESTAVFEEDVEGKFRGKQTDCPDLHLQSMVYPIGPGETKLRLTTTRRGLVVVSEPYVPGWRVWNNGRLLEHMPSRVDGFFLGLLVDPGRNDIHLEYDPVSQRLGLYLTLLTLGALGFLIEPRLTGWFRRGKK